MNGSDATYKNSLPSGPFSGLPPGLAPLSHLVDCNGTLSFVATLLCPPPARIARGTRSSLTMFGGQMMSQWNLGLGPGVKVVDSLIGSYHTPVP